LEIEMRSEASAARERRRQKMRCPEERKRLFLDHLAETYDVDGACAAAGLPWIDMCQLRDEDPDFAAEWERVIAAGYERIEIMLLQIGGAAGPADEAKPDLAIARELVKQRASRRRRPGTAAGAPKPNKEREIMAILRRLGGIRADRAEKDDGHATDTAMAGLAEGAGRPARGRRRGKAGPAPGPADQRRAASDRKALERARE
jgi:hypothetical protein